jgi:hypothetical protein
MRMTGREIRERAGGRRSCYWAELEGDSQPINIFEDSLQIYSLLS